MQMDTFDEALQKQEEVLEIYALQSDAQFKTVDSRLNDFKQRDENILKRIAQHYQSESMTAMKTQFKCLMAHMMSSLAPGYIAPSPPSRRSHLSTLVPSLPQAFSTALVPISTSMGVLLPTKSSFARREDDLRRSMPYRFRILGQFIPGILLSYKEISISSTSSDQDSDSDLSALGDILYSSLSTNPSAIIPSSLERIQKPFLSVPVSEDTNSHNKVAPTDSNVQYTCASTGGAPL